MVAGRLQRRTTTLATRMEDASRVCLHLPSAPGSDAALCRRLRASSRRYHRPNGPIQQPPTTQDRIKLGGKVRHPDYHGASPIAMEKPARRKGYRLIGANRFGFNTI